MQEKQKVLLSDILSRFKNNNQINQIRQIAEEINQDNYLLIDYESARQPVQLICPKGHEISIHLNNWRSKGQRCKICHPRSYNTKPSLEANKLKAKQKIIKELKSEGFGLVESSYISREKKFEVICPKGHQTSLYWTHWLGPKQQRCSICNKEERIKQTTEEARKILAEKGYELLQKEVINKGKPIKFRCDKGHEGTIIIQNIIKNGSGCGQCADNQQKHYQYVKELFDKENYELLSKKVINNRKKLHVRCPKGHDWQVAWGTFIKGHRCGHKDCFGTPKHELEYINSLIKNEKYSLLSGYKSYSEHMEIECDKGHKYRATLDTWKRGHRCPVCNASKAEKEIEDFLKSNNINFVYNDRKVLGGLELDFYLPEYNFAIEHCGLYYHSDTIKPDRKYHLNKLELCEEKGIRLFTLFANEWSSKQQQVMDFILGSLGVGQKIYARNSEIKEVKDLQLAKDFLNSYHLQGAGGTNRNFKIFGLYYNDQLLQLMVFGKHHRNNKDDVLTRFCTKAGYQILGGASKLFKSAIRQSGYTKVITWADRRYAVGGVYDKLGFVLNEILPPDYVYCKRDTLFSKQNLKKKEHEKKSGKTEYELRLEQGYHRIWDCGKIRFVWNAK